MNHQVLLAFLLTTLAGLSTGIGSALSLLWKKTNKAFLSASLGLSAGVMIYVSFVELFADAVRILGEQQGSKTGEWVATAWFFAGILTIALIDRLVPEVENPHEARTAEDMDHTDCGEPVSEGAPASADHERHLMRLGLITALAIGIHNFPEGMATFVSAMASPSLGLSIAVAIAIHNIPEGISVAVPIFHATGSRKKAFWLSFLSGISEPVGALVGYLILRPFMSESLLAGVFAWIAGVMVFISLDELLPAARRYGYGHLAIYGLVAGMAVMAFSLLIM